MRITSNSFYQQFSDRQKIGLKDINEVNNQISTGTTIRHGYEDPTILSNTLKLDHTEADLVQSKKVSEQARSFADNSDSALGGFMENLILFKTKMVNASNGNHSITSLNAIGVELEVIVDSLKELSKSSINGHYLFSGSNVLTPPIDDDFVYHGNNDKLKVLVGNQNSVTYNVPGKDLFLGSDADYHKKISTNISHYNKVLKFPKLFSADFSDGISKDEYITHHNTIREMVGDNDNDKFNDKKHIFYVRGINTNGDRIKAKLSLDSNDKISTLTRKIEEIYDGYVDVSINKFGQFELKDRNTGNSSIDFHIVSASDFSPIDPTADPDTVANKADKDNLDDVLADKDVYITEYIKSFFNPVKEQSTIVAQANTTKPNEISLKGSFLNTDGSRIKLKDTVKKVINSNIDSIEISARNVDGELKEISFKVDDKTTIRSLLSKIEDALSTKDRRVIASFGDENLVILDPVLEKGGKTKMQLSLSTPNHKSFNSYEAMNLDKIYLHKDKNTLTSNVDQVTKKGKYASRDTKLSEMSSSSLDDKIIALDLNDIDGKKRNLKIHFNPLGLKLKVDGDKEYNIINSNDKFLVGHKSTSDKINVADSYELAGLRVGDKLSINGEVKSIKEIDIQYRHIILDTPLKKQVISGDIISYDTPSFKRVEPNNFTFGQLMDIIAMGLTSSYPAGGTSLDYQKAIESTKQRIDIHLDNKGKFVIQDLEESLSKIDLAIYDTQSNNFSKDNDSPVVTFNANNAVVIDQSHINFFEILNKSIDNVKDGRVVSDGNNSKNSRNMGILYSLEGVDHLIDHVSKVRAFAGANSLTLGNVIAKANIELANTKKLKSEIIDTDLASAILDLKQRQVSYQVMLSTANRLESLSLLKYLK